MRPSERGLSASVIEACAGVKRSDYVGLAACRLQRLEANGRVSGRLRGRRCWRRQHIAVAVSVAVAVARIFASFLVRHLDLDLDSFAVN